MRRTLALTLALMTAAMLAGCVSPTPQQAQDAKDARTAAERLFSGFSDAMQVKDPTRLQGVIARSVTAQQFMPMALKLQSASWLKSYSGYTLEPGPALDRVSWSDWATGQVELEVPGTNAAGGHFRNRFVLAKMHDGWCIKGFTVAQPKHGDPLDPPAAVVDQIRPLVQQTLTALREGHIAEIWYNMPKDTGSRYRMPVLSFWQKIGLEDAANGPISLYDDLTTMKQLPITGWPDPAELPELTWLASGAVLYTYELPYAGAAEDERGTVRLEMTFLQRNTGWSLYMLRFYGDPIPFSE